MTSHLNTTTPTGILRRTPSIEMSGKRGVARFRDNDFRLGSPTSRTGVHFAAPENFSDLLHRAASSDRNNPNYQKVNIRLIQLEC